MKKERKTITLYLDEYLKDVLGEQHSVPLRANIAEVVESLIKGQLVYHIQWPDKYFPELKRPLLWSYPAWIASVELWERQRKRSNDERVARFIFEENVKLVAKQLTYKYKMPEDKARPSAFGIMKSNTRDLKVAQIGFVRLIEKESEL